MAATRKNPSKPSRKPAAPKAAKSKKAEPKATAAKPAKGKPAGKKAAAKVEICITPPDLAPRTTALQVFRKLASPKTRPSMTEIAALPWLAQDRAYRVGYYLLTRGLAEHAGHPELEMCNVPGVFLEAAHGILSALGNAVLGEGLRLADGEVLLADEDPLSVIGFRLIKPHKHGTIHDADVMRVVFLA
ncbi:MAG: hypothetical protein HY898_33100 [Deltaproteobacteria bacterium]|nr:hypothetical protein [Deltaproteobacteria bacterium]